MSTGLWRRISLVAAFVIAVGGVASALYSYAHTQALEQIAQRGRSDLALASDRLRAELQRYRELGIYLADHPLVTLPVFEQGLNELFVRSMDKTTALDVVLLDAEGHVVSNAIGEPPADWSGAPFFQRAMDGALGSFHAYSPRFQRRAFYYAAPVFGIDRSVQGVVVVVVDIERIERDWRGGVPVVFFTDDLGVVFIANREELLYLQRGTGKTSSSASYEALSLRPFLSYTVEQRGDLELWALDAGRYVPARALHLVQEMPVIGMRAEALVDIAPAAKLASLQAAVVAAILLAFGALLFLATERRRTLTLVNQRLEDRVAQRTAELERAQADLVQAGKLSALGKMSAGISHELNQPLMAVQSFAENAALYLERDRVPEARANLVRISDMAHRMGRIIKNLRAFARQEKEPVGRVDLTGVIRSALELSEARMEREGVSLVWSERETPVLVRGGEVRLQQVVLNLISNALDAMVGQTFQCLSISVTREPGKVTLCIADTGPGIEAPEKIFDPFYSTKEVGASEGMGLGLSISYGLVQSFGGMIRGENAPEGGALFTVELQPWQEDSTS
ncbi:sensor histidine kinase [Donghicola eburneus]|uniref:C4-dicarboxylate transport sensor protein DctB n=1 Tax=Donghicola eburneus TaxID=393278 RepID=A0A1M4N116_9RHOB|nr:ATP-binding protein [Donghicola eburneus]SCM68511.1 putative C4-dicarboxylate ABC transporter [Donghicola eburneus]SFQ26074.1 two-component system, NtrC family, C4-dicarboxylate transport sensor histidine kinase DctB [Donghicola eburneus]